MRVAGAPEARCSARIAAALTAAKRTPVGSFLGAFAATPAHELGRVAITAALEQAGLKGEDVSEVILGQVLTAAQGQNPARQAAIHAGIRQEAPAFTVNQVCGSGLRAVGDHDEAALGTVTVTTYARLRRDPDRLTGHPPIEPAPEGSRGR